MDNMRRFETIRDYNAFNNNETLHPLVSVVDLSKASPRQGSRMYFGLYTIFLKDVKCGDLVYGRHTYDYQEGTDLIHGTPLGKHIQAYTFFSYQSNEALHLSERERKIVMDCFS